MHLGKAIEPMKEIVAYEALLQNEKASFKWRSKYRLVLKLGLVGLEVTGRI